MRTNPTLRQKQINTLLNIDSLLSNANSVKVKNIVADKLYLCFNIEYIVQ